MIGLVARSEVISVVDRSQIRRLEHALAPALLVLGSFLVVATWMLVETRYPIVALLLVVHVGMILGRATRSGTSASAVE